MIQKLQLLFSLLDLSWNDEYVEAAQWMIDHPTAKLLLSHPAAFAFEEFSQLLAGNLSEEEFLALGDISSSRVLPSTPFMNPIQLIKSIVFGLEQDVYSYANMFILVQQVPGLSIPQELEIQLSKIGSVVFVI